MNYAEFNLTIALIIRTEAPIELITNIIGYSPSKCVCDHSTSENLWIRYERYKNIVDIEDYLSCFFVSMPNIDRQILAAKAYGSITLRLSLVSEYGQFGFVLSPTDLALLQRIDVPLEVSIFSLGNCMDESASDDCH